MHEQDMIPIHVRTTGNSAFFPSRPSSPDALPRPITPVGAHLFRAGYDDRMVAQCLPFVSISDHQHTGLWDVPAEYRDGGASESQAADFGRRAAAAYFIYNMSNGPAALPLTWISEAMAASPGSKASQIGFWSYLGRLLYLYGFSLSAAQVANDVEADIAEGNRLMLELDREIAQMDVRPSPLQ